MKVKKNYLLSKAAKGQQQSDVANTSIRNLLNLLSEGVTQKDMEETEEFFNWKCPYTGVELKERIINRDDVVLDHIVPQNRKCCGLNVKGNLVWVDKEANAAKQSKTVEDFLLNDKRVLENVSERVRKDRLRKIKQFQKICGYNPEEIQRKIADELETIYKDTTDRQKDLAMELEKILSKTDAAHNETSILYSKDMISNSTPRIKRHMEKYLIDGNEYSKRRLALYIVGNYCKKHPDISYEELKRIFNLSLSFDGKPIVRLMESVSEKEKNQNRVFWRDPIKLGSGEQVVVNTQWQKDDMPYFIKLIRQLGYNVSEVSPE